MKNHFLQAPEEHLSKTVKAKIKEWSANPTPTEVRETIAMAKSDGSSMFAIKTLERYLVTLPGVTGKEKQAIK